MNNKKAFTLIELLVVVLIIGILAAVALPQYQVAVGKARIMQLVTLSNATRQAQERYYLANGTYTNQWNELDIDVAGTLDVAGNLVTQTSGLRLELQLARLTSGSPNAILATDTRLLGVRLITAYQHAEFLDWNDRQTCYAKENDVTANTLCKYITKTSRRRENAYGDNLYWK